MPRLTELAHDILREVLHAGDTAIDATAGKGSDTLFLAEQVGPAGKVLAFDIQEQALNATRILLANNDISNVELIHRDHALLGEGLACESVSAITFNLGYLPGGDREITTRESSTLAAIQSSLKLLCEGGILTILAYRGHAGGQGEARAVQELFQQMAMDEYEWRRFGSSGIAETTPILHVIRKRARELK